MQDESGSVLEVPLDNFSFCEVHGLRQGSREVDVPLIGPFLPGNQLNLGWIPHEKIPLREYITLVYILEHKPQQFQALTQILLKTTIRHLVMAKVQAMELYSIAEPRWELYSLSG